MQKDMEEVFIYAQMVNYSSAMFPIIILVTEVVYMLNSIEVLRVVSYIHL